MKNQNILISGGGIAGLTLAYWLHQPGITRLQHCAM
jgi:2-polyprenyl-6-methoxyphenol hydroxylase-like FAD-dependent oxidoreductase